MRDYQFGEWLATLRVSNGYSQFQLGKLLGVSDKAVSKWETGKATPRLDTCRRLADVFSIPIEDLLGLRNPEGEKAETAQRKALWEKTHGRLYELFGERPPVAFLARLESEKIALQASPMIHHLDFAGRMMAEAEKQHTHVIPRGWVSSFLAAWLLGATFVNPLAPYTCCPHCHRTVLHPSVRDGWDLPHSRCVCGKQMMCDGHHLPFEGYADISSHLLALEMNVPGKLFAEAEHIVEEMYAEAFVPVPCDIQTEKDGAILPPVGQSARWLLFSRGSAIPKLDKAGRLSMSQIEFYEKYDSIPRIYLFCDERLDQPSCSIREMNTLTSPERLQKLWDHWASADPATDRRASIVRSFSEQKVTFSALCQVAGLEHGTGIWENNGEALVRDGTAQLCDLAAFREDVWHQVLSRMTPQNGSGIGFPLKVMNNVRMGRYARMGMDAETRRALEELGVPSWYLEHISRIRYQFPKGHTAAYVISELTQI